MLLQEVAEHSHAVAVRVAVGLGIFLRHPLDRQTDRTEESELLLGHHGMGQVSITGASLLAAFSYMARMTFCISK